MNTERQFLITYGLHNFVSCAIDGDKPVFTICREEGQKMARHAKSLITGKFGKNIPIRVI